MVRYFDTTPFFLHLITVGCGWFFLFEKMFILRVNRGFFDLFLCLFSVIGQWKNMSIL